MNIVETIRDAIVCHNLIPDGKRVVIGVSGGADSVALLRAFQTLEIPCTVAHMNHQLRGAESDADEQFVRRLADELGFPMVGKSVDVQALAKTTGQSVEMAARQARHDFFSEFDDAVIALAHHADDQVETFILKLARGAGTEGLCGMPLFQRLENLQIIRPMLGLPRAGIFQWLEENGFKWREDSSNSDERFLRNKVRHTILPMLGNELNPKIRETILRTMDILRAENEWMEKLETGNLIFDPGTPLAAKRRTIRKWLFEQGVETAGFEAVEQILKLMDSAEGSTIFELNDRQRVVVEYGTPRFEEQPFQPLKTPWKLTEEPGTGWKKDESRLGELPATASVSAKMVGARKLAVRAVRPGDRFAPFGMKGTRKLQDILTDHKIPRARRNQVPVVLCGTEIIWIPGYRIARGWELKNAAEKAIHLKLEQNRTD
ncbi:tRNA lysidine(34) synthetase TilS [Pontiellaceae bacterium B1224]|nr:tRNA lysidine(34) synthetase TilS [Pontiellaceae bacterium B1224]